MNEAQKEMNKMQISIFRSPVDYPHVMYGNAVQDNHSTGDTFDRFYIYSSGRIEICERTKDANKAFYGEADAYEILNTSLDKPTIEHTLSRVFGNGDIEFEWESEVIWCMAPCVLDRMSESLEAI